MFEQAFKNIDDVLWKEAGCTTELDYTEQTSWPLFLKYLDGLEQDKALEAELEGKKYAFILDEPYRWESWAAPKDEAGTIDHNTALGGDDLRDFVTAYVGTGLRTPRRKPPKGALTPRQKAGTRRVSRRRIVAGRGIGKRKAWRVAADRWRNPRRRHTRMMKNAAGLHNRMFAE